MEKKREAGKRSTSNFQLSTSRGDTKGAGRPRLISAGFMPAVRPAGRGRYGGETRRQAASWEIGVKASALQRRRGCPDQNAGAARLRYGPQDAGATVVCFGDEIFLIIFTPVSIDVTGGW